METYGLDFPANAADGNGRGALCQTCQDMDIQPKLAELRLADLMSFIPKWNPSSIRAQHKCAICRLLTKIIDGSLGVEFSKISLVWARCEGENYTGAADWPPRRIHIFADVMGEREEIITMDTNRCLAFKNHLKHNVSADVRMRKIQLDKVDVDLIRQQLAQCEQSHPVCSSSAASASVDFEFRVIDAFSGSVIQASPDCSFIALSYVWGEVEQIKMTQDLMKELSIPGSLWKLFSIIPRTIRDAIVICRELNERYLWVDSLCVSAEGSEKHRQIQSMDIIYSSAKLTIVDAASNNANGGLPGVNGRRREISQAEEEFGVCSVYCTTASISKILECSTWSTRGWTFQEFFLSRRLLIFTPYLSYFVCRNSQWREDFDMNVGTNIISHVDTEDSWSQGGFTGMGSRMDLQRLILGRSITTHAQDTDIMRESFYRIYLPVVNTFLHRSLSRTDDILNAVTGILKTLSFDLGELRYGIPRALLNRMLAMRMKNPTLTRRDGFPSWSWSGWMHSGNGRLLCPYTGNETLPIHVSLLSFYTLDLTGGFENLSKNHNSSHSTLSSLRVDERILNHTKPGPESDVYAHEIFQHGLSLMPHHIIFWTSFVTLPVEHEPSHRGPLPYCSYNVTNKVGKIVFCVNLKPSWRQLQPSTLDFILVGLYTTQQVKRLLPSIMLVETIEGVSYRVNMVEDSKALDQTAWLGLATKRKLIVLG